MNKYLAEISLTEQAFVKNPDQTVAEFVASKGGKVKTFVRYEVGEGMEKRQDNFAPYGKPVFTPLDGVLAVDWKSVV